MSYNAEGEKRQKLIQWDEVTIAEHDRERGSRQKIDEAPTPYRYLSESDCESGGSDGEGLAKARANTSSGDAIIVPPPSNKGNTVSDSWEAISAKLYYEKHLQDCNDQQVALLQQQQPQTSSDAVKSGGDPQHLDISTEFGEIADPNASPNTRNGFGTNSNGGSSRSGSFRGKSVFAKSEATAANGNHANGSSSNSNNVQPHSILHHSHGHHSNHNIHFSNAVVGSPVTSRHNGLFSGLNGSIGGNSMENVLDESHDQFKSKRAGHYNEFKVVQAMRARMAAKRSSSEDDDDDENGDDDGEN